MIKNFLLSLMLLVGSVFMLSTQAQAGPAVTVTYHEIAAGSNGYQIGPATFRNMSVDPQNYAGTEGCLAQLADLNLFGHPIIGLGEACAALGGTVDGQGRASGALTLGANFGPADQKYLHLGYGADVINGGSVVSIGLAFPLK